ncbi:YCF48-related protein [Dyadobacter sp. CY326]|uniref:WD40/YVTN/BNR-like repeat-containing protein n=1 Tax=Dyadobacter sp. CY326 TaxID=2907300 RepID=UPI001F31E18E|nr:YCF48-related protein [Dyadobacter sp. CY326]MCE7068084.1 YCF48-related protein [Dyadobacter sp. CY326]
MPQRISHHKLAVLIMIWIAPHLAAAQWKVINIKTTIHMRAVHAVSPTTCWIGGTKGTVLRTTNGGKDWLTSRVDGADSLDFRDIHAFNKDVAIAMSAGEAQKDKAKIYRTEDGGISWSLVYQTTQNGVFLDGIDFWDKNKGICLGDPIDGRLFILTTDDGGKNWQELPLEKRPVAEPGEACFAASGTSIIATGKNKAFIGTGGSKMARVFRSADFGRTWEVSATPMPTGPTSGIFGLTFWSKNDGMAVGGDYKKTADSSQNVLITKDGGVSWKLTAMAKPAGLKESVSLFHKTNALWNGNTQVRSDRYALISSGPSGSSFSENWGKTWYEIGKEGFHATSFAGGVGYGVGANGLIGKIEKFSKRKKRKLALVEE